MADPRTVGLLLVVSPGTTYLRHCANPLNRSASVVAGPSSFPEGLGSIGQSSSGAGAAGDSTAAG